mmetsp:Transcript_31007/g.65791  ORF Transcript_31007/g.65791 Transcript_31007/m.65791 type:complete len:238 (-) Transcript_31007:233-946(-)
MQRRPGSSLLLRKNEEGGSPWLGTPEYTKPAQPAEDAAAQTLPARSSPRREVLRLKGSRSKKSAWRGSSESINSSRWDEVVPSPDAPKSMSDARVDPITSSRFSSGKSSWSFKSRSTSSGSTLKSNLLNITGSAACEDQSAASTDNTRCTLRPKCLHTFSTSSPGPHPRMAKSMELSAKSTAWGKKSRRQFSMSSNLKRGALPTRESSSLEPNGLAFSRFRRAAPLSFLGVLLLLLL